LIFICETVFPPLWESLPGGAQIGAASAADRYVSLNGTNDADNGYTNWVGAATNIQLAVDVALANETVWVSNGVYVLTNQIFITNAITLKSFHGRAATSINGNYPSTTNRCVYVSNVYATVDGFSISNGYVLTNAFFNDPYGGGVYLKNGTVINCLVSSNYAVWRGGGIYCNGDSQHTISNCVIEYNKGGWGGGGISVQSVTRALIINCNISCNIGYSEAGGGIKIYAGGGSTNMIIRNCVIGYNYCSGVSTNFGGAGLNLYMRTSIVENCTIIGNTIASGGNGGGGIGGRAGQDGSQHSIKNCIIYSNSAPADFSQNWCTNGMVGTVYFNNCTDTTNNMEGTGNITGNPMFVDWATTNLRLSAASSPCINAGINQDWMNGAFDFDGHRRILNGRVDMGAYEAIYDGTIFQAH